MGEARGADSNITPPARGREENRLLVRAGPAMSRRKPADCWARVPGSPCPRRAVIHSRCTSHTLFTTRFHTGSLSAARPAPAPTARRRRGTAEHPAAPPSAPASRRSRRAPRQAAGRAEPRATLTSARHLTAGWGFGVLCREPPAAAAAAPESAASCSCSERCCGSPRRWPPRPCAALRSLPPPRSGRCPARSRSPQHGCSSPRGASRSCTARAPRRGRSARCCRMPSAGELLRPGKGPREGCPLHFSGRALVPLAKGILLKAPKPGRGSELCTQVPISISRQDWESLPLRAPPPPEILCGSADPDGQTC